MRDVRRIESLFPRLHGFPISADGANPFSDHPQFDSLAMFEAWEHKCNSHKYPILGIVSSSG